MARLKLAFALLFLVILSYGTYDIYNTYKKAKELEANLVAIKTQDDVIKCPKCEPAKDCNSYITETVMKNPENKLASILALHMLEKKIISNKPYKNELDIFTSTIGDNQFILDKINHINTRAEAGSTPNDQIFGMLDDFLKNHEKTLYDNKNISLSIIDKVIKIESKAAKKSPIDHDIEEQIYKIKLGLNNLNYNNAAELLRELLSKNPNSSLEMALKEIEFTILVNDTINDLWNYLGINIMR